MGPVEVAIRATFTAPVTLYTFGMHKPFKLSEIDEDGIVLRLGEGGTYAGLSWDKCLEPIPAFLRSRGWIRAGGTKSISGEPGTLDEYLKDNCTPTLVSRWLAVVLADAGVVDIDEGPPLCVRLRLGFGH
jgi:hypothetical protein